MDVVGYRCPVCSLLPSDITALSSTGAMEVRYYPGGRLSKQSLQKSNHPPLVTKNEFEAMETNISPLGLPSAIILCNPILVT